MVTKKADFPKGDPENPVTEDEPMSKLMQLNDNLFDIYLFYKRIGGNLFHFVYDEC